MKRKLNDSYSLVFYYIVIIALGAFISLTLNSNPFAYNGLSTDSGGFMSTGVFITKLGLVPYKDFFDHKGPLIFFINAFAALFKNQGLGLWIIELITLTSSALLIFETARLYTKSKGVSLFTSIVLMVVLIGYLDRGNLVEEYSLPFILLAQYLFISFIIKEPHSLPKNKIILIGVCLGAVLMLRPNMIAVWFAFGLAISVYFIFKKRIKDMFISIGLMFLGVLIVLLPIAIYLAINHALWDFYETYILFNFAYIGGRASLFNVIIIMTKFFTVFIGLVFTYHLGMIIKQGKNSEKLLIHAASFAHLLFALGLAALSTIPFNHYRMPIIPALVLGVAGLAKLLLDTFFANVKTKWVAKTLKAFFLVFMLVMCFIFAGFKPYENFKFKGHLVAPKTESTIVKAIKANTTQDETLFVMLNNSKLYYQSVRKPASKYFYQSPITHFDPSIIDKIIDEFDVSLPNFVVVPKVALSKTTPYTKKIIPYFEALINAGVYELIAPEGADVVYYKLVKYD